MASLSQLVVALTSSLALQLVAGDDSSSGGEGCDWQCTPITECPMVFRDLVRAKIARQNENKEVLNKVISGVRNYLCDSRAETVCCPVMLGRTFRTETAVYAVNNNTVILKTGDKDYWANREVFFWREETCFPWLDYSENHLGDIEKENAEELEEEVRFALPPGLTVYQSKCLSVWSDNQEIGFAFLKWPLDG